MNHIYKEYKVIPFNCSMSAIISRFFRKALNINYIFLILDLKTAKCSFSETVTLKSGLNTDELSTFENFLLTETKTHLKTPYEFYYKKYRHRRAITHIKLSRNLLHHQRNFLQKLHEVDKNCLRICRGFVGNGEFTQTKPKNIQINSSEFLKGTVISFDIANTMAQIVETSYFLLDELYLQLMDPFKLRDLLPLLYSIPCVQNAFDCYYRNIVFFAAFCIRINKIMINYPCELKIDNIRAIILKYYVNYIFSTLSFIQFIQETLGKDPIDLKSNDITNLQNLEPGSIKELMKESLTERKLKIFTTTAHMYRSFFIYCIRVANGLSSEAQNNHEPMTVSFSPENIISPFISLILMSNDRSYINIQSKMIKMIKKYSWLQRSENPLKPILKRIKNTPDKAFLVEIEKTDQKIFDFLKKNVRSIRISVNDLLYRVIKQLKTDNSSDETNDKLCDVETKIEALKKDFEESISKFRQIEDSVLKFDLFQENKFTSAEYSLTFYTLLLQIYGKNLVYVSWIINQIPKRPFEIKNNGFDIENAEEALDSISEIFWGFECELTTSYYYRYSLNYSKKWEIEKERHLPPAKFFNSRFEFWNYEMGRIVNFFEKEETSPFYNELKKLLNAAATH